MDIINPRTVVTPEAAEAMMSLFKVTPNEMAMKMQAYITTGIVGVIKESKVKRLTVLKRDIREMVHSKLSQ